SAGRTTSTTRTTPTSWWARSIHVAAGRALPGPLDARDAGGPHRARIRGHAPGALPRLDRAAEVQPRRVPLGRAVADARDARPAADRPLASGLICSGRRRASCGGAAAAVVSRAR